MTRARRRVEWRVSEQSVQACRSFPHPPTMLRIAGPSLSGNGRGVFQEAKMKWWFGRKAARGAARPFLFRAWGTALAVGEWPRSYEAQVREAYLGNPVAQRAVRLVAESVAWAPLAAEDGGGGGGPGGDGVGGAAARALRLAGPALLDAAASHLLLHGNAYL